jgi:hypothetical protein
MGDSDRIEAFIVRWSGVTGSERANDRLFITERCALLVLPLPEPARQDTRDDACVFARRITFAHGEGSQRHGFVDCCKRAAFVLVAQKVKAVTHTKGFDDALMGAGSRAEPA